MNILLLAHDLSDAAIAKRIRMLRQGGAQVTVAGFRRTVEPIIQLEGCAAVDLGMTKNGGFIQRILMVLKNIIGLNKHKELFENADVIIARNLEMLSLANIGKQKYVPRAVLIYEILDIHRLLLGQGLASKILRWLERRLLRQSQAIFTSSPAFVREYFGKINRTDLHIRLIENKIFQYTTETKATPTIPSLGLPWIIGWFGIIRCRKSFHILAESVRQSAGTLQVIIRGRPARDQIPEFDHVIRDTPGMQFDGPYKNPDDLASLYSSVHFNWALDMYEEGLNSSWLLPNRLYEGGAFGAIPIALSSVETGHYLKNLGIGILLDDASSLSLTKALTTLTPEVYSKLCTDLRKVPQSQWVYPRDEAQHLIQFIAKLVEPESRPHA